MLPILPVLILLLLQGPSSVERLTREGRLPAALDAIHRELALPEAAFSDEDDAMLASLFAAHDPHFSSALFALLRGRVPEPESPRPLEIPEPKPEISIGEAPAPCEGFAECRRSRDGPFAMA